MNKDIKALWVSALRSGEYVQGWRRLNFNGEFCCLGVLCELAVQAGVTSKEKANRGVVAYEGMEVFPPRGVCDWAGLPDNGNPVMSFSPPYQDVMVALADMNDVYKKSFNYIADVIERQL